MNDAASGAAAASKAGTSIWTPQRVDLMLAIKRRHEVLGGLYHHAIQVLGVEVLSMSDFVVVSHCLRELCNRLPDAMDDVEDLPRRSDTRSRADRLVAAWAVVEVGVSEQLTSLRNKVGSEFADAQYVPLPIKVVEAVRAYCDEHRRAGPIKHVRFAALVIGSATIDETHLGEFKDSNEFFVRYAHASAKPRELPPREEILRNLSVIEQAISDRLTAFFKVAEELDGILESANRRSGV